MIEKYITEQIDASFLREREDIACRTRSDKRMALRTVTAHPSSVRFRHAPHDNQLGYQISLIHNNNNKIKH